ncbi:MAG: acetyl-CoA carboxylase biotin carboxyl carrier protein subunit [Deltaproteobacteria bacterium]|nr:acetyl-CoA carboxylase biotin carboxyl carrier protein subunit [Deltaproteobacteria bacterium]
MDLKIDLNGNMHKVALPERITPGQSFRVKSAGRELTATLVPYAGVIVLRDGNDAALERNVHLRRTAVTTYVGEPEAQLRAEIRLGGRLHYVHAVSQPDMPGNDQNNNRTAAKDQVVRSQITGKVLKVLVKKGDQTTSGQALLVIEAMKMENRVFTNIAGTVASVAVKEGDSVNTGKELLRIKL